MYLNLTEKETEVLKYIQQAYTNQAIADRMHVSEQTIKNHISSIIKKVDKTLIIPEEVNTKVWLAVNTEMILNSTGYI